MTLEPLAAARPLLPDPQRLARFAAAARPLLDADASARLDDLRARLHPAHPTLGPLFTPELHSPRLSLDDHRRLLRALLGHEPPLGRHCWQMLTEWLRPARGPRWPADGEAEWPELDLLAWAPQGWGLGLVMAHEQAQAEASGPRLDLAMQRARLRLGEDVAAGIAWVFVSPRGALPQGAWGSRARWRARSWAAWRERWAPLAEEQALAPSLRLALARYAALIDDQLLTGAGRSDTLRELLRQRPDQRALCAMQRARLDPREPL